jgi:hypothetical protein
MDAPAKETQDSTDKGTVKGNTLTRFVDGAISGLISGAML